MQGIERFAQLPTGVAECGGRLRGEEIVARVLETGHQGVSECTRLTTAAANLSALPPANGKNKLGSIISNSSTTGSPFSSLIKSTLAYSGVSNGIACIALAPTLSSAASGTRAVIYSFRNSSVVVPCS